MSVDMDLDVSRETLERLELLAALTLKWTQKINLVSRQSEADIWARHILDSVQVFHVKQVEQGSWVDLGSGGGFPGLVIAALRAEKAPSLGVILVESDVRKCVFLRTALREMGVTATVLQRRIESIPPLGADILSARALSDLSKLLEFSDLHLDRQGTALFPKGENWKVEVEKAKANWSFSYEAHKSKTNTQAVILEIGDIARV